MKKIIWIPLIILIIGVCLALAGFANGGMKSIWFDRTGFHLSNGAPGNLVTVDETYSSFKNIEINADYINRIVLKEGDKFTVRGQNYENHGGLDVSQDGDTIRIDSTARDKWQINIGLDELFKDNDSWLEVTYPAGAELGLVKTNLSAGRVAISGINCDSFNVDNDYGNIEISSVQAGDLTIIANAGDINLSTAVVAGSATIDNDFGDVVIVNIKASDLKAKLNAGKLTTSDIKADTISIKNDFGKVEVNGMEADRIVMDQNAGDLEANDISARDLKLESDFGAIRIDRLSFMGLCEISNNSGDVRLKLLMNKDDVSYELEADAGSITVDGHKSNGSVSNRASGGTATLDAETDFGSIDVEFLK